MICNKALIVAIVITISLLLVACGTESLSENKLSTAPTPPGTPEVSETTNITRPAPVITVAPALSPDTEASPKSLSPVRFVLDADNLSRQFEGTVEPPASNSYLFQGLSGYELDIVIESPGDRVNFELVGLKDRVVLKHLVNEDRHWTGILPLTQEYQLDVAVRTDNGQQEYSYVLTLAIGEHVQDNALSEPPQLSPDGQWQAVSKITPPEPVAGDEMEQFPTGQKYHAEMVVSRVDGSQSWTVVDEWRSWGIGYTYPEVLAWSSDGRTLFFTNVPVPDGCAPFVNGGDLWQIDLDSGMIDEILPFVGLGMALSPDERQLAYFGSYGKGMTMLDLLSMEEEAIELPYEGDGWGLGDLTWSPDGDYLVLTQVFNVCMPNPTTTVVRVDPKSLEAINIVELGEGYFRLLRWLTHEMILLLSADSSEFTLNIITGEQLPVSGAQDP